MCKSILRIAFDFKIILRKHVSFCKIHLMNNIRKSVLNIIRLSASVLCLQVLCVRAADADGDDGAVNPAMEEEFRYVEALVDANYPDIAKMVIASAVNKWPECKPRMHALEMKSELRLGHFDVVKAEIARLKKGSDDYWALNLAMADIYYSMNEMPLCRKIYEGYFNQIKKELSTKGRAALSAGMYRLFVESAYKWAQMLKLEKSDKEASSIYEMLRGVLTAKNGRPRASDASLWAMVASDEADLKLKLASEAKGKEKEALLKKVDDEILSKLLWMQDEVVPFGKAIAQKAHVKMLRGEIGKAQEIVQDFMEQLLQIHESLKRADPDGSKGSLSQSPMPACRYLLAKILWDEARKEADKPNMDKEKISALLFGEKKNGKRTGTGAFNHAINVFVKYPESTWAASSGDMADQIKSFVKDRFGKEIKTQITEAQRTKVRQMQFRKANESYRNHDYKSALTAYRQVLAQYPESPESVGAIANMIDSILEVASTEKDPKAREVRYLEVEAVEGYLAERFSGFRKEISNPAGEQVVRIAAREADSKNDIAAQSRANKLYSAFLKYYPKHYLAPQLCLSLASEAKKSADFKKARGLFLFAANNYSKVPKIYESALNGMYLTCKALGDADGEIEWLSKYEAALPESKVLDKSSARLAIAYAKQKKGKSLVAASASNPDPEAAAAQKKEGMVILVRAAQDFRKLAAFAEEALAKSPSEGDAKKLTKLRSNALFLVGETLQNTPIPKAVPYAIDAFEKFLAAYPKESTSPLALLKLGTLYMANGDTEKQRQAFSRLEREFPKSEEAKFSKPRLAQTLMELGQTVEGVKQYKEMISTEGKYSASQLIAAGDALVEHGDAHEAVDAALTAYNKAIKLTPTNQFVTVGRAMLGKAKAYEKAGGERFMEALDVLTSFADDKRLASSTMILDAYRMTIEVASKAGVQERNDAQRASYFGQAIDARKKLRARLAMRLQKLEQAKLAAAQQAVKAGAVADISAYKDEKADQEIIDVRSQLDSADLSSGDIQKRRMDAEFAMDKKEQAEKTRKIAIVNYNAFIQSHQADNPARPFAVWSGPEKESLKNAYERILPLMADACQGDKDMAELAVKYADAFTALYPEADQTVVRNARTAAQTEL